MYKFAAVLVGLPDVLAGLFWIFDPMAILALWGVNDPSQALMVERRLGVVLVGIGVILLLSRNAEPSPARSAISYGVIIATLLLLMVSVQDLLQIGISSGIVPGMVFTLFIALAFALIEWKARRDNKKPVDA